VAVGATIVSLVSDADFREFGKEYPQVYEALVALLAARLRETDTTIAAGTFLPLRGRVACTLLELAQEFGQDVGSGRVVIHQKIGQRDLAPMSGIARESGNRILSDLKCLKLISQASGYYWIEDKAQLQNEAAL